MIRFSRIFKRGEIENRSKDFKGILSLHVLGTKNYGAAVLNAVMMEGQTNSKSEVPRYSLREAFSVSFRIDVK